MADVTPAQGVDLLQLNGTALGAGNPVPTRLSDGTNPYSAANPLPVTVSNFTQNQADAATATVNAGASGDLDFDPVTSGKIGSARGLTVGATVAVKWQLKKNIGGVDTVLHTVLTRAGESSDFDLSQYGGEPTWEFTGDGTDFFRITAKNIDNKNADVYATFAWNERNP